MRAGRHYTAYGPSESRADDRVFRLPLSHAAKTAVAKQFYYVYDNEHRAGVAQSVEQRIRNAKVGGSIPFSGTISTDKRPSEKWFSDGLCVYWGVCSRLRIRKVSFRIDKIPAIPGGKIHGFSRKVSFICLAQYSLC